MSVQEACFGRSRPFITGSMGTGNDISLDVIAVSETDIGHPEYIAILKDTKPYRPKPSGKAPINGAEKAREHTRSSPNPGFTEMIAIKYLRFTIPIAAALFHYSTARSQIFAVSTNALALPLMAIEIEGETALPHANSIGLDLLLKPAKLSSGMSQIAAIRLTGRKYHRETFLGPFAGYSAGYVNYRSCSTYGGQFHGSGALATLSIGYSMMLTRRMNLTMEAGACVLYSKDQCLYRTENQFQDDIYMERRRITLLPFPLSISISYIF